MVRPNNRKRKIGFIFLVVDWLNEKKMENKDETWEEASLPGLDLTPKQLFWVTYGQLTCQKFRDDALVEYLKTDAHSPGEFRLKGPLININEFAKDFACPIGSPMNPSKKFEVW